MTDSRPPHRVAIESPFAGSLWHRYQNRRYARAAMRDSLARGEHPFAMHLLYPQVLQDSTPEQRTLGIAAGLNWASTAHYTAVYVDRGITRGMREGIEAAYRDHRPITYRSLYGANLNKLIDISWRKHSPETEKNGILE